MLGAFAIAQEEISRVCDWQSDFLASQHITPQTPIMVEEDEQLAQMIAQTVSYDMLQTIFPSTKNEFQQKMDAFADHVVAAYEAAQLEVPAGRVISDALFGYAKNYVREQYLQ